MRFVNLTPHAIRLNDGREFAPAGLARVQSSYTEFEGDIASVKFGEVTGLPEKQDGVTYIVSSLVAQAAKRDDLVAPATGHPLTKRDEKGQIVSVPGFIR